MARSKLPIVARWDIYKRLPEPDIFDWWWMVSGFSIA